MADTIKIVIGGDLLPWRNNYELFESGDSASLFGEKVKDLFSIADFSIINLEGPLTDSDVKQTKIGPVIKAGKDTIKGLAALKIKAVALANNHITDYLDRGVKDTIDVLKENEIQYVGVGLSVHDIINHISLTIDDYRICVYNVSEYFFNAPGQNTAGVNLYDEYRVCNEIKELKKVHDYLIVIYHGGAEYFPYPTPQTRKRFHRMADSGADFITAQHTHCIGCEEWYNGAYLLYGQGNFLFAKQSTGKMTTEGLVVEINLIQDDVEIIKHRVQLNSQACLDYASEQSLHGFYERSRNIDNEDLITDQYKNLKPDNIIYRYLMAYKGNGFILNKLRRFIPKIIWKRLAESYSSRDIMRNIFTLTSDRANEDVYYIWQKLLDKNNEQLKNKNE